MMIEPVCGVVTVFSVYARGPASDVTRPSPAAPTASRRPAPEVPRPKAASATAANSPPTSTTQRSHGSNVGDRSSRTYDQTAVPATVTASTAVAAACCRRCQSTAAPMPTSAAM
ncbi:hypothetical protein CCS38_02620 [Streptomyces purpurogeneiscleroticus]|nr:hypothetical protein [Streptomyces purpurogeneiscleroticus]